MSSRALVPSAARVGAVALVLAVAAAGGGAARAQAPTPASQLPGHLVVQTALQPNPTFFGDLLDADVTVDFDGSSIAARGIVVSPDFAPYLEVGAPQVSTSRVGDEATAVYRYTLQCVNDGCLPGASARQVQFPPVVVTAAGTGRRVTTTEPWPPVIVTTRLSKSDLAGSSPSFRSASTMPPPDYTVSPAGLAAVLAGLGVLLALAAFALIGIELAGSRRDRRRRAVKALSPLEAAIAYTREAADRADPTDRRKAIGLLARTLAAEGHDSLAASTTTVAWSDTPPSPANARTLADEAEQTEVSGQT